MKKMNTLLFIYEATTSHIFPVGFLSRFWSFLGNSEDFDIFNQIYRNHVLGNGSEDLLCEDISRN